MDNYNGQNQYGQPQQQMYAQSQNYGNGYRNPRRKPKKNNWLKWLLIIGLPVVVIATTIIIIVIACSGYDIDDRGDFSEVCENVLDVELKKQEVAKRAKSVYGMTKHYYGDKYIKEDKVEVYVNWYEFKSDEEAENYFNMRVLQRNYDYYNYIKNADSGKWETDGNIAQGYYVNDSSKNKTIMLLEDEYIAIVTISGKKASVDSYANKWLEELD